MTDSRIRDYRLRTQYGAVTPDKPLTAAEAAEWCEAKARAYPMTRWYVEVRVGDEWRPIPDGEY